MRRLLAITSLIVLAACGAAASVDPTPASFAGTWFLTSLNGDGLPYVLQAANPKREILNDALAVNANGTFVRNHLFRTTNGTTVTIQSVADTGTFALAGNAVTFRLNNDGSTLAGSIAGNRLTVAEAGFIYGYTRPEY